MYSKLGKNVISLMSMFFTIFMLVYLTLVVVKQILVAFIPIAEVLPPIVQMPFHITLAIVTARPLFQTSLTCVGSLMALGTLLKLLVHEVSKKSRREMIDERAIDKVVSRMSLFRADLSREDIVTIVKAIKKTGREPVVEVAQDVWWAYQDALRELSEEKQ